MKGGVRIQAAPLLVGIRPGGKRAIRSPVRSVFVLGIRLPGDEGKLTLSLEKKLAVLSPNSAFIFLSSRRNRV